MPLPHSPQPNKTNASGRPTINQIFAAADEESDPTFFDLPTYSKAIALSILEVDGAGDPVAPAGGFTIQLLRSIDYDESYQVYASYTAVEESFVTFGHEACRWKFKMTVKGINDVRVRAMS